MRTLTASDKTRVAVVSVLGLLAFVVVGVVFHDIARSTIQGFITIGILLLIGPAIARKRSDRESNNKQPDRDETR